MVASSFWNIFAVLFLLVNGVECSYVPLSAVRSTGTRQRSSNPWIGRQPQADLHISSTSLSSTSTAAFVVEDVSLEECGVMLQTAEKAARAAGDIIRSNVGCGSDIEGSSSSNFEIKKNIKDIVTEHDKNSQVEIEKVVQAAYPEHSFLGEEDVPPGGEASAAALEQILNSAPSGFLWICDPIDGTANFAAGLPYCVVTIGVCYQGVPLLAVTYDPHRDEMFSAIKGQGAYLNGKKRLQVSTAITEAKDAIINAGCPADSNAFEASMRGMLALNKKTRGMRVIACSALTTAYIAAGRLSGHFGYDLSSWDLVAGALLIHEAGGLVTDLDGTPYKLETRNMLCSNGLVHEEILGILKDANAVSFERAE